MLTYLLGCAGVTLILTRSSLLAALRAWIASRAPLAGKLVECPMCAGFWVGALSTGFNLGSPPLMAVMSAFASALGVALWDLCQEAIAALALWRWLKTPRASLSNGRNSRPP